LNRYQPDIDSISNEWKSDMTITKRPVPTGATAIDEFINRAPDAESGYVKRMASRRKQIISLGIAPESLTRIDSMSAKLGISRAAAISLAISQFIESEPQ
jgi:hypothetical protein